MSTDTLSIISDVIADVCGIDRADILPDKNAIDDLAIDSIDMLDIMYELNQRFGVKIPVERWSEEISSGAAHTSDYFVLKSLARRIDELALASASGGKVAE